VLLWPRYNSYIYVRATIIVLGKISYFFTILDYARKYFVILVVCKILPVGLMYNKLLGED